jgi:hypothetical protein
MLDDAERRIDEERARLAAKKMQEHQQKAKQEAERAKQRLKDQQDNHLLW